MSRTPDFSDEFADASNALSVVTRRPVTVIRLGTSRAIRVDFEYSRYLIATVLEDPTDAGQRAQWRLRLYETRLAGTDTLLAEASSTWLIDAYDAVVADLPDAIGG